MRRLLLLLLTFLIPLQLLAATGESRLREQLHQGLEVHSAWLAQPAQSACHALAAAEQELHAPVQAHDALQAGSPTPGPNQDDDQPSAQGELEEPGLPTAIATLGLHWYPFPHALTASLNWSSYLRDQLRPPPLA
ncbi:hypothetical protein RB25_01435 [Herbaspirillum rubrisubalbicans]|uniref:Uncharacterized protein n=2 Tax=Herbaspirillum rubrisubalbicans TaxID=80842 RepID=A0ABX9C6B0_9BURK|nr:hypothetical protein [Herbaspirillum rubrisubalbicans]MCP1572005.1 hypothetical protein [Herbaspirillum rubrisubalbicans]QJQ00661.1 hypothetical protein C798_10575 [Herbaspirillum rubrisubalbicans Os34]RAM66103.1 hypothetical protein RB24_03730 [Herbaspirillum rubrisubalbicans]RAN50446.1 hypothetical protein RB25_01435 [Herbaspirillum rubrisubalbicans]